jgi:hypothetical protein
MSLSTCNWKYSGRKIAASFSYVTESGEGQDERAKESKMAENVAKHA